MLDHVPQRKGVQHFGLGRQVGERGTGDVEAELLRCVAHGVLGWLDVADPPTPATRLIEEIAVRTADFKHVSAAAHGLDLVE